MSENSQSGLNPTPISPEIVAQVKNIVAQYLPGMQDANLHLTQVPEEFSNLSTTDGITSTETSRAAPHLTGRHVIAMSKNIIQANHTHTQYARLTMDESGKLLKLTISR